VIDDPRVGHACPACHAIVTAVHRDLGMWVPVLVAAVLVLGWIALRLWR
jgi:hypothetical protein